MTPPLLPRHRSKLPSPASSPSLSSRSSCISPPTIRIDNSVLTPTEDPTENFAGDKKYQLPPVNSWNPKGESLFNGILDTRSPQIYRRTGSTTSRPLSNPQSSPQAHGSTSRVSWPQGSQAQLSPPPGQQANSSDSETDSSQASKSPKLLHKCSSFDLERSKPFPARATISSPLLIRKSASYEDTDMSLFPGSSGDSPKVTKRLERQNELSSQTEMDKMSSVEEVPQCTSEMSSVAPQGECCIDTLDGGNAVKYLVLSSALEFDSQQTDETKTGSVKEPSEDVPVVERDTRFDKKVESGAKPKKKSSAEESRRPISPKIVAGPAKTVAKDSSKAASKSQNKPVTGKTGLKHAKKEGAQPKSDKSSPKSAKSSMKSALMTSAAKLKAIGKRSPVTLLSYKSDSITIPKDRERSNRPSSTSALVPESGSKRHLVHQTDSSPSVLVSSDSSKPGSTARPQVEVKRSRDSKSPEQSYKKQAVTKPSSKPEVEAASQSQGSRKTCLKSESSPTDAAVHKDVHAAEKSRKKDRWMYSFKPPHEKNVATTPLAQTYSSDQQEKGPGGVNKASSLTRGQTPIGASSQAGKKAKDVGLKKKEDKGKMKTGKRDSISSVHSEAPKKSDHFRDCCHGKKK